MTKTLEHTLKRERLLRRVIEATRKVPDIVAVKQAIVNEIGKTFNADRCYFTSYDKLKEEFLPPEAEYRSSPDIISIKEIKPNNEGIKYFLERTQKGQPIFYMKNTKEYIKQNNLEGTPVEQYLKSLGIKSNYPFPMWDRRDNITYLVLHYVKKTVALTREDIKLLEVLANQAVCAIDQSLLYEKIKKQAKNETLIRNIIEIIRSTLDIQEIKQIVAKEIGKTFNADRCYFRNLDKHKCVLLPPEAEYLKSSDIKSLSNETVNQNALKLFFKEAERQKNYVPLIMNQELLEKKGLKNTILDEYFLQCNIKTNIAIPICDYEEEKTFLVLNYKENKPFILKEDALLMEILAKQVGMAIDQAKLYENEKKIASRERLLRKITETIRGTLDINKVLLTICDEVAKVYNVQRATIVEFLNKDYRMGLVRREYKARNDIKGLTDIDFNYMVSGYVGQIVAKEGRNLVIENISESDAPDFFKELYSGMGVKSILSVPIKENGSRWGLIFLSEYDNYRHWAEEEITFLENISNQIYIAINQSELYETIKQKAAIEEKRAAKESLLRKVTETIRETLDIDKVLLTICDEVAKVYNVQRSAIVEFPNNIKNDYTKWITRREYKAREDIKGLTDIDYDVKAGEYNGRTILSEGHNLVIENLLESDTPNYYKKTYNEMGVKSILSVPIKQNGKKWGIIFLSEYDDYRHWTKEEVNFLENISNQVYMAINQSELYETIKQKAIIEETRKTYLATLIHDLRSPIIGEQKALEYILSRKRTAVLDDFYEFLNDIYITNKDLLSIVNTILEIYHLESGKLKLNFEISNISDIIDESIHNIKYLITENESKISVCLASDLPLIKLDGGKIKRTLINLITNALKHNEKGVEITVTARKVNDYSIQVSVKDNGIGIEEVEKINLFQQYPTAKRKMGTGLGLYLSRLIIEAHNGKIWLETEHGRGTTFYFTIPIDINS